MSNVTLGSLVPGMMPATKVIPCLYLKISALFVCVKMFHSVNEINSFVSNCYLIFGEKLKGVKTRGHKEYFLSSPSGRYPSKAKPNRMCRGSSKFKALYAVPSIKSM